MYPHPPRAARRQPVASPGRRPVASPGRQPVEKFVETPAKVPTVPSKRRFDLKSLRPAFLVAAIVFLVLSRGAPLIAAHVPFSIDAVTGKFTVAGLAFVSILSGGAFLGLIDLVDRFSF